MKKLFYTMAVIAIFAIGFAASGDDDEVRYDSAGREYHKVRAKCHNCGRENPNHDYWQTDDKSCSMGTPQGNMKYGRYYCNECLSDPDRIKSFY